MHNICCFFIYTCLHFYKSSGRIKLFNQSRHFINMYDFLILLFWYRLYNSIKILTFRCSCTTQTQLVVREQNENKSRERGIALLQLWQNRARKHEKKLQNPTSETSFISRPSRNFTKVRPLLGKSTADTRNCNPKKTPPFYMSDVANQSFSHETNDTSVAYIWIENSDTFWRIA